MSKPAERLFRIMNRHPGVTCPEHVSDRLDNELIGEVKRTAERIFETMVNNAQIRAIEAGSDATDEDLSAAMQGAQNAPSAMGAAMFLLGVAYGQTKVAEESASLAALLDESA